MNLCSSAFLNICFPLVVCPYHAIRTFQIQSKLSNFGILLQFIEDGIKEERTKKKTTYTYKRARARVIPSTLSTSKRNIENRKIEGSLRATQMRNWMKFHNENRSNKLSTQKWTNFFFFFLIHACSQSYLIPSLSFGNQFSYVFSFTCEFCEYRQVYECQSQI